ncbi:MAG: hypothetical protein ACPLRY_07855 [Candidatus Bathyarchaeales archaeon]
MGFSVTITSSIVLIVLFAISSSFLIAVFQGIKETSYTVKEYVCRERERLDAALQLTIDSVSATECNITVKNTGSNVIFFKGQNEFKWNTIIISYGNDSFWSSYPIEEYEILEVKVSGTNHTFTLDKHSFLNAGEEAEISFHIPNGAPEIPLHGLVSVVFVTHYGATAKAEAVRKQ